MHSKNSTKKRKKSKKSNKDNSRKVTSEKLVDKIMNAWRKKEWIGEYLTNKDMAHLRQTNKKAKEVINEHNKFKKKNGNE